MRKLLQYILIMTCVALLPACGDSQHSSPGSTIKAVIKRTALTSGLNIAGINLSITVPAGVSPAFNGDGTVNAAATVEITSSVAQGQNLPGATYTPATATASAHLDISAIVASGFSATDEITIHLNVAAGTFPVASDFTILSFSAFDTNGAPVNGLKPTLTTTIQ